MFTAVEEIESAILKLSPKELGKLADFSQFVMTECNFSGADFTNVWLSETDFSGGNFNDTIFRNAYIGSPLKTG